MGKKKRGEEEEEVGEKKKGKEKEKRSSCGRHTLALFVIFVLICEPLGIAVPSVEWRPRAREPMQSLG